MFIIAYDIIIKRWCEYEKDILMWSGISTILLIILPLLALTFVSSYIGMAALILMLLIISPIYFVMLGIFFWQKNKRIMEYADSWCSIILNWIIYNLKYG